MSFTPEPAPDFELIDQYNVKRSLKDYKGQWLVVYFYPKDDTLGCTQEACEFRDVYRIVSQFGSAEIIGINKGSIKEHRKFSDKHRLNFPILSDPGHKITKKFGAWSTITTPKILKKSCTTNRNTYLINPDGLIVKKYLDVQPENHAAQVISDLQKMQKKYSAKD